MCEQTCGNCVAVNDFTLTPAEAYLAKDLELGVASCRS